MRLTIATVGTIVAVTVVCAVWAAELPVQISVPEWSEADVAWIKDDSAEHRMEYLRGAEGVRVHVYASPVLKEAGISEDEIRTTAELVLRKAGIKVHSQEATATEETFFLGVGIDAMASARGYLVYSLEVQVREPARLITRGAPVFATVWEEGSFGSVGAERARDVLGAIESTIKAFANDFLAANPPIRSN